MKHCCPSVRTAVWIPKTFVKIAQSWYPPVIPAENRRSLGKAIYLE